VNSIIRYVRDTYAPAGSNMSYILHSGGRYEHGFITLLFYCDGQPIITAKISRGNNKLLTKEFENLQKVRSIIPDLELRQTIEEPLSFRNLDGRCVLFTKYIQGLSGTNYLLSFFYGKSRYSRLLRMATKKTGARPPGAPPQNTSFPRAATRRAPREPCEGRRQAGTVSGGTGLPDARCRGERWRRRCSRT